MELYMEVGKKKVLLNDEDRIYEARGNITNHKATFWLSCSEIPPLKSSEPTTIYNTLSRKKTLFGLEPLDDGEDLNTTSESCTRLDTLPGKVLKILDDMKHVWVACSDGHVRIYDKEKNMKNTEEVIPTSHAPCTSLELCRKYVWLGFLDGTLQIFTNKGKFVKGNPVEFSAKVTNIVAVGRAVWTSADKVIAISDEKGSKCIKRKTVDCSIQCMLYTGLVWIGTAESSIQRWDPNQYKIVDTLQLPGSEELSEPIQILTRSGDEVLSVSGNCRVCVWSIDSGTCLKVIEGSAAGPLCGLVSVDIFVWMCGYNGIAVYDKVYKDFIRVIEENTEKLCSVSEVKIADQTYVWTGNTEGHINIWNITKDLKKGQQVKLLTPKQKQSLISNWQQIKLLISNINVLGESAEPQTMYDAVTVLDKVMTNF